MTITTTDHARWPSHPTDLPHEPRFSVGAGALRTPDQPDAALAARIQLLIGGTVPVGDPHARARIATALHQLTGWDVFAADADRAYVSRLWAQDWDSPDDAVYDEE